MTELCERAPNELVRIVAEDMAHGWGDVKEGSLEGDDMEEVRRVVKQKHMERLVAIVQIEHDGLRRAVGESNSGGSVSESGEIQESCDFGCSGRLT